jgi:type IV pilus assembly protein PilM
MANFLDRYFNFIRRCIPDKPAVPAVGIDIGSADCKMVEIEARDGQFVLTHWDVKTFGDDVGVSLREILEGLKVPAKAPNTAVFGKGTLIRYVELPRMPLDDLKRSFEIEADKYFPFARDQIYTDCIILDPDGKGNRMMVMAAAARKEMVNRRVELLSKLGLGLSVVGVNPVALLNVISRLGLKDAVDEGAAVALLDMGESVSSLSILVGQVPWFTRDIFIGGRDFTGKIQNNLGISFKEAEELKINPRGRKDAVMEACELVIMSILQELRLSFDYFTTEKDREVKKLLLTGGGSMLDGIVQIFAKHFEVKVEAWNPFENVIIPDRFKEEFGPQSLRFGVALGLALYDYN